MPILLTICRAWLDFPPVYYDWKNKLIKRILATFDLFPPKSTYFFLQDLLESTQKVTRTHEQKVSRVLATRHFFHCHYAARSKILLVREPHEQLRDLRNIPVAIVRQLRNLRRG